MIPCGEMPSLPPTLIIKSSKEQAEYLLLIWAEALNVNSACSINQAALTKWIKDND